MAINKVVYGNQVLIDITDSTVNPNTLLAGYKAYGANGQPVNGALQLSYHITLHEEQYNALSEAEKMADENWFYIDDIDSIGAELDDSAISPAKVWSSQKTNSEIQDVQDQVDINTTDIGTLNSALDNKQNIETSVTLLRQSNTASWAELSISDINQYSHIIVSVSPQNSNIEYFPLVVPTSYFKTKVSSSNYMGGYFNIGTSNYGFGAYYKNDTTVGLYISSTSYFVNIKGIK